MKILAIDPGNLESAWLLFDTTTMRPVEWGKEPNVEVIRILGDFRSGKRDSGPEAGAPLLAVEMVASYGMPVGREVFETCVWIGQFIRHWDAEYTLVYRTEIKMCLTGSTRAKDANVRQALLDEFGPGKELAVGKKATPGPLYGITGDCWSALAVAFTTASAGELVHPQLDAHEAWFHSGPAA